MPTRSISDALYETLARDADRQCGYCRAPQDALPYRLEVEHLLPISLGGTNDRENLWLSCHKCNKLRSNRVEAVDPLTQQLTRIFNPRRDAWNDHFQFEQDGLYIVGRTAIGRATVSALRLNDAYHASAPSVWIAAGIYPPQ